MSKGIGTTLGKSQQIQGKMRNQIFSAHDYGMAKSVELPTVQALGAHSTHYGDPEMLPLEFFPQVKFGPTANQW